MIHIVRPPKVLRGLYKEAVWRMDKNEPKLYLTFDDGPIPGLTPWVLDILKKYQVKATFFCVGDNIRKHPDIYERILQEGHSTGNHTFHHVKGWKTKTQDYLLNTEDCQKYMSGNLFRPPYGRMKKAQYSELKKKYKIILWDVLSYDYDRLISPEKCLKNVIKYTRNGSIILFHDNLKAEENVKFALPKYIEHCFNLNYKFAKL